MSTRITLWFDMAHSPSLSPDQKELILHRLQNRIGKDGVPRVMSQQTRSQAANRALAMERFTELLRDALRQAPIRKKTPVSKAAKQRRLEAKKRHGILKQESSARIPPED